MKNPLIRVLCGGPYHPTRTQFETLDFAKTNPSRIACHEGSDIFDHLHECDLLVVAGLHWTGMGDGKAIWLEWPQGQTAIGYQPPTPLQKEAFVRYVASGRPLFCFHGGIACYDDWTEFGTLLGYRWDWKVTSHTPFARWKVDVLDTRHLIVDNLGAYEIDDELYFNIQMTPGLDYQVHATATYHDIRFPMIMTAEGGRITGAGKTAYLANGHDLRSTSSPALQQLISNAIHWLLS